MDRMQGLNQFFFFRYPSVTITGVSCRYPLLVITILDLFVYSRNFCCDTIFADNALMCSDRCPIAHFPFG